MDENKVAEKPVSKADEWRERIAEQQSSGLSIKQFCKQRGIAEHSFYDWRKRLREKHAVRFAVIDRGSWGPEAAADACLEILLTGGERIRVGAGADAALLRVALEALRG